MRVSIACAAAWMLGFVICGGSGAAQQKGQADWSPPNVDAPLASLDSTAACPEADLLEHAGQRAQELVDNLQSFTAREAMQYEQFDELGVPVASEHAWFEYAVGFDEHHGGLRVTEARTPVRNGGNLPSGFQDSGLPAVALIFHPYYRDDYDMRCEGATIQGDEKEWVIRFEQRKNKASRTRSFRTEQGSYPAKLKGLAWISAGSQQVTQIETNSISPIPMIHLKSDAVRVEYAPVPFASRNLTLWLPRSRESYSNFETYRIAVKHSFSNYLLSSVQTQQVIGAPPKNEPPKN